VLAAHSRAQPTTAPALQRWEYASFVRSDRATVWQAPDESHMAEDVHDVYRRLGGTLPKEKVAETNVLNAAGRKGWELVAVTHLSEPTMTCWFKRPAR
jgi:hypothetical protein